MTLSNAFRDRGRLVNHMAHVRKDTLTKTVQWWKHLRPYWKRRQQRRERVAAAKLVREATQRDLDLNNSQE
jgi:hypothetical protein